MAGQNAEFSKRLKVVVKCESWFGCPFKTVQGDRKNWAKVSKLTTKERTTTREKPALCKDAETPWKSAAADGLVFAFKQKGEKLITTAHAKSTPHRTNMNISLSMQPTDTREDSMLWQMGLPSPQSCLPRFVFPSPASLRRPDSTRRLTGSRTSHRSALVPSRTSHGGHPCLPRPAV